LKDYRIVRLAALHGLNASHLLATIYPDFSSKSYKEQLECLFKAKVLYSDGFSLAMRELGRDAHEIVWDFESLQRKWAEENGVRCSNDNWMFDVLLAQIKTIQPDVVYFQGTELAIPGRFEELRSNSNLATALKEECPFIRLIAMLSGFPSKGSRLTDVDVLFSASPSIQQHYENLGFPSLLCYHAFDQRALEILGTKNLVHDFSFVGSARAPEQRYWDLLELLDRTVIQLWIDEAIIEPRKSYFLDRKRLENDLRSQIRNRTKECLKMVGETGLKLLAGEERVPSKIRNLAIEIISEINISSQVVGSRVKNRNRRTRQQSLRDLYPDRCHDAVLGVDYFGVLNNSRVTFNKHTDQNNGVVGNLRMFEATGIGTCLLTDDGNNINDLFEPGKEIVTYSSVDEAVEKVAYLLDHEDERAEIARAGQKKTLMDHTIFNRCQLIDNVIQSRL
jgi:hypothetical protein